MGVRHRAVTEVDRERDHVRADGVAAIRTRLQGSDGQGVTQGVRHGPRATTSVRQPDVLHCRAERRAHFGGQKRSSPQRDKHLVIERRMRPPLVQIAFESGPGRVMQGDETALAEFRAPNSAPTG